MMAVGWIALGTSALMILSVLFFPRFRLGKLKIDTYWVICLGGALLLPLSGLMDWGTFVSSISAHTAMNPLKIVTLFISIAALSVFLDEIGFFEFLASWALSKAKTNQVVLFLYLYLLTSILTMFTANDIIILTLTPFICYFAKNAKINPIPYLVAEFAAANTWSMMFIIGNPTNIYLGVANGLNFFGYFTVMALPTLAAGLFSLMILFVLFHKQLKAPMASATRVHAPDALLLGVGLCHLAACTILLSISSYIGLEMWWVTLAFALSLLLSVTVIRLVKHQPLTPVKHTLRRMPWALIPFVLSMAVLVGGLNYAGITDQIRSLFGTNAVIFKYGLSSFFSDNLINNIPMSILFAPIVSGVPETVRIGAIYATIIGSNLGAILTPIGALAGIMWMSILKDHGIRYTYVDFLKYGVLVAVPTLLISLWVLLAVL